MINCRGYFWKKKYGTREDIVYRSLIESLNFIHCQEKNYGDKDTTFKKHKLIHFFLGYEGEE